MGSGARLVVGLATGTGSGSAAPAPGEGRGPVRARGSHALLVLVGPTASGKSALAVRLARALGGEVLNADSRQVYRGLDVGTAKPTPAERGGVPHHLFDLAEPEETFSAARFRAEAVAAASAVRARGRLPVVVGGTGLYLRALLHGLFPGPARDPDAHRRLEAIADAGGLARLFRWLERVDPEWARRVGAHDRQRILRGLDVWRQSGRPLSEHIRAQPEAEPRFDALRIGLDWPREELYRRIERRADAMMEGGFLDEVRRLRGRPGFARSNAAKALGYRSLGLHLDGRLGLAEAVAELKRDTRRLAKRQLTWFRHEPGVRWLPAGDDEESARTALALARRWLFGAEARA